MNIFQLVEMLSDAQVDYVIVGGLAVALQGYQRTTLDVDIVLAMDPDNLDRFIKGARAARLHPVAPVALDALAQPALLEQWRQEKGMLAFALRGAGPTTLTLDVLIHPVIDFANLRRDATLIKIGAFLVPIASIAHLIEMKTGTGRSKDALDIEALRRIQQDKTP